MFKKLNAVLLGLVALAFSATASAAIDVTAVLTGITDAQTALLSVIGGLMALSVAIFGIVMVYKFVRGKAGA